MKHIKEDERFDYFIDNYGNCEITIMKDKHTQEIYFDMDNVAKYLGFNNVFEMMQDKKELVGDLFNGINKVSTKLNT